MALDLFVPEWLTMYIRAWCDRLCLKDWRIKVSIELCINNDPNVHAMCKQHPDLNEATILFRADVEDTKDWRRTVIHELIHVAHSRIDHAVEDSIIPQLPAAAHQLGYDAYHQHVESYTAYLAETLYNATVAIDYPEECKDDKPSA